MREQMTIEMLKIAAKCSLPTMNKDPRGFWLGAVGIRDDGAIVYSRNGSAVHDDSSFNYKTVASVHAEGRILKKLGKGGVIYVARVSKLTRKLAMARPCGFCQANISAMDVKKVIYSINEFQYGVWDLEADTDKVYTESNEIYLDI